MRPLSVIAAILACTLAAAGVAAGHERAADCTEDAILVFDASGSMASAGYNELDVPRIQEALEAVRVVLPKVAPYRRIGLVTYGPGALDACSNIDLRLPPTANAAAAIIAELQAITPDGDTPLTESVRAAAEALDFRHTPATIVLVTDGDETCGGAPCRLAAELTAKAAGLTVHVIGFKVRDRFFEWGSTNRGGRRGDVVSRCLADTTGGLYVSTETTDELIEALQKTLSCPMVTDASRRAVD